MLHLPNYQRLEFSIASPQELLPSVFPLFLNRKAWVMEGNVKSEHGGFVRMKRRPVITNIHRFTDIAAEAEAAEPLTGSKAQLVKKSPVGNRDVCYQDRRDMELIIGFSMAHRQV